MVGVFVYPIILIIHFFVHVQTIGKWPWITAILISHGLLLAASLLRVDADDASSYAAVDVIARRLDIDFRAPGWVSEQAGQEWHLMLLVLVGVSWLFVFPFSNPKLGKPILVAILLPWWHFYTIGRPLAATLCFVLVLTTIGWIPASIWALFSLFGSRTNEGAVPPKVDS